MSTTWEHRIVRHEDGTLQFAEVHYDGRIAVGFTEPFMTGDDINELRALAQRLAAALDSPVIDVTMIKPLPSKADIDAFITEALASKA